MIVVVRGGLLTTVQDLGRSGYRGAGVPRGGAMDPWSARAANRLVGNRDDAALLEATLVGPALRFESSAWVAWVGGDFEGAIDGARADGARAHRLVAGATLELGRARAGARCWLAIAGGIEVEAALGSRSTDLAGGFGGHAGRPLAAGDRLTHGEPGPASHGGALDGPRSGRSGRSGRRSSASCRGRTPSRRRSNGYATGAGARARSDRRGVRLELERGAAPAPAAAGERRSQGTLPGAVQAPPSGEAIVLGPDAPVTGGYPWVAQVIEADLGRLAHLAPGSRVALLGTSVDEASAALAALERALEEASGR
ncbi:MAG: biotin-dependent carboxyltransferase family protein [Holophagales bacterium]|nr:biotin-dependent carboxyltransferase family protein [Holophagales bacterium]